MQRSSNGVMACRTSTIVCIEDVSLDTSVTYEYYSRRMSSHLIMILHDRSCIYMYVHMRMYYHCMYVCKIIMTRIVRRSAFSNYSPDPQM